MIHYLSKENISAPTQRLSVVSYERYYETVLVPEMRNQYMINDGNFERIVPFPTLKEKLKWIFYMLLLFQWYVAKDDKEQIYTKICNSKWMCHWINPTITTVDNCR
jgi:hypothetical protein